MAQATVQVMRSPLTAAIPTFPLAVHQPLATEEKERKTWTPDDLLALADDENRYELVRGELIMTPPASVRHGKFAARLVRVLSTHIAEHNLGEVYTAEPGFELASAPPTVRAPDVAFVQRERIPPEGEPEGFWAIAPDLVIEIISPSETAQMIHEKVADYLQAGTQLLWVVYPTSQTVMEYCPPMDARRLTIEDDLDGSDVVPGFCYPLEQLFA